MKEGYAHNSTFAIAGGSFSAVRQLAEVKGSAVLRINICAEKPAHRKSDNLVNFQIACQTFPTLTALIDFRACC